MIYRILVRIVASAMLRISAADLRPAVDRCFAHRDLAWRDTLWEDARERNRLKIIHAR
jgi:hypothetical protein